MSLSFTVSLPAVRETAGIRCTTPEDAFRHVKDIQTAAQECFVVLTLDTKNRIIDRHLVTLGILNASLAHPREVFRPAILDNAASIIAVHNHPSGDPSPSAEDLRITRQLIEAGKLLDIQILDHVIIGRTSDDRQSAFISLREAGLCAF